MTLTNMPTLFKISATLSRLKSNIFRRFPWKLLGSRLSVPTLCQLCLQTQFANCTGWQGVGGPIWRAHRFVPLIWASHYCTYFPICLPLFDPQHHYRQNPFANCMKDGAMLLVCWLSALDILIFSGENRCKSEKYFIATASRVSLLLDFTRFECRPF